MIDPVVVEHAQFEEARRARSSQSGGGNTTSDGGGGDIGRRIAAVEKSVDNINSKLDKIIEGQGDLRLASEQRFGAIAERLANIDAKLDTKASATDLAEIKGRVNALPTTWQMITLVIGTVFTILGGSFLILKLGLPHAP